MAANPNRLSQFWQELKRRKVIKAIAMYAGGAYVLIELANNVVVPLNLPDWTPRLVIIIALVGFPIMVVLSWIFDITPEGIGKTESLDELEEQEPALSLGKRKLKTSDVIIAVLLITVGILVYPRIFGSATLNAMTMPVTVVNELGEKETRRVYKKDYISRLCIFPFKNETKDTIQDWLQYGIPEAVKEDLFQFSYIYLDSDWDASHFQEQLKYAEINNNTHLLTGVINENNGIYEITSRLYHVANGAIRAERIFRGSDLFSIIDSISHQTRIDLGISALVLNSSPDISISGLLTDNIEAYRIFIENGIRYGEYSTLDAFFYAYPAIELDSTFAYAMLGYAKEWYQYQQSKISTLMVIEQAMRHRHRLSEYREIDIRKWYYMIQGDSEKAVALAEMQLDQRPFDIRLLLDLIDISQINLLLDKYVKTVYQLTELTPGHSDYQIMLARAYLLKGSLDKGLNVLNKLLKENPQNAAAMMKLGEIYLHKNDLEAAEEVYNKIMLLAPEKEKYWSMMLDHIAYIRKNMDWRAVIESVSGSYKLDWSEQVIFFSKHNNHLLGGAENQGSFFLYPASDTVLVAILQNSNGFMGLTETLVRNKQGKVFQLHQHQSNRSASTICWKKDSLIQNALDLIKSNNISKAFSAFQIAYEQNPEHYYLANFIQHLEFILGPEYEKLKPAFTRHLGKYGDLNLFTESKQYFYKYKWGQIYQMLPLSKGSFMIPSMYDTQLHILNVKDTVSGLKLVYRDGDEEFYPRSN